MVHYLWSAVLTKNDFYSDLFFHVMNRYIVEHVIRKLRINFVHLLLMRITKTHL